MSVMVTLPGADVTTDPAASVHAKSLIVSAVVADVPRTAVKFKAKRTPVVSLPRTPLIWDVQVPAVAGT
jgi:hypothetical protein